MVASKPLATPRIPSSTEPVMFPMIHRLAHQAQHMRCISFTFVTSFPYSSAVIKPSLETG
jgi:hypothetical protein